MVRFISKADPILLGDKETCIQSLLDTPANCVINAMHPWPLAVNHSYHLVDPVTGVHTNFTESQWWSLHRRVSRDGIRGECKSRYFSRIHWRYSGNPPRILKSIEFCILS